MQDLNDLYYFVSVVDHGGFARRRPGAGPTVTLDDRAAMQQLARLE
jgi:hypothetical protein